SRNVGEQVARIAVQVDRGELLRVGIELLLALEHSERDGLRNAEVSGEVRGREARVSREVRREIAPRPAVGAGGALAEQLLALRLHVGERVLQQQAKDDGQERDEVQINRRVATEPQRVDYD